MPITNYTGLRYVGSYRRISSPFALEELQVAMHHAEYVSLESAYKHFREASRLERQWRDRTKGKA